MKSVKRSGLGPHRGAIGGQARQVALLAALGSAIGCGPMVNQAPFSARPESVGVGDLLGPFDGLVIDDESERPVEGAIVSASWAFERGLGLVGPYGSQAVESTTGSDGRYRIARLAELPHGTTSRVSRFTLIVYKRGYVGWRSDRVYPDGMRRHDFSQYGNRVRLVRWSADDSHVKHLLFLGGGPEIQRAVAWEREPASLELEGRRVGPTDGVAETPMTGPALPVLLDVQPLLSDDELRAVTGFAGAFERKRLQDRPRTEFYDTIHFAAVGESEQYDVALRVWRLGETAAAQQYRELLNDLPDPEARDEVGDTSVRVLADGVRALVFLLRGRGLVASVTCGAGQCPEPAMVVRLAKLVENRMDDLPALPAVPVPSPASDGIADPFESDAPVESDAPAAPETESESNGENESKPENEDPQP